MEKLEPCPLCGGEVAIADMGHYLMITRVSGMKANSMCKCRIFMESDTFAEDDLKAKNEARKNLIEKWNNRSFSVRKETIIGEVIESIRQKHCYDCDCLEEGKCYGCDVYTIIGEIGNDFVAEESEE